jgi:Gluconate 2-dehydrogenase subunit 3
MTEPRPDRYPGYDVLAKRNTPSWNEPTRRAIDKRLSVPREPRFFTPEEWQTLQALCDRILPQPGGRPPVPLAAYVDQKLLEREHDGYRYAELPEQGEAWKRGLAALEEAARREYETGFAALGAERQDEMLRRMERDELRADALQDMPSRSFFRHRVIHDIVSAYYAHPTAWSEIGFGGPASPRGYVRLALDRRDPWEASEARPGREAKALRENKRVG